MHNHVARLALIALSTSIGFAQSVDRVFDLTQTESPQEMNEIATTVRSIGMIKQVSVDAQQKRIFVHGTAEQVKLAEFLVGELNKPVPETAAARKMQNSTPNELRLPGERFDIVRVFYMDYVRTPQDLQEAITLIRSMTDMTYAFVYNKLGAIALRGTSDQMALAGWLVNELNKPAREATPPAPGRTAEMHEYKMPGGSEAVRMFYLANSGSPQRLQEIATIVRTQSEMKRVFINNALKAVASRGDGTQLAIAERVVREMDRAAQ